MYCFTNIFIHTAFSSTASASRCHSALLADSSQLTADSFYLLTVSLIMTSFPPIVILRGVRTLCEKAGNSLPTAVFSQNKRPPKRSSIVSLQSRIRKRSSVQRPMYSLDLLYSDHVCRMLSRRSCSKRPVLHSSVRQRLLWLSRTSRLH